MEQYGVCQQNRIKFKAKGKAKQQIKYYRILCAQFTLCLCLSMPINCQLFIIQIQDFIILSKLIQQSQIQIQIQNTMKKQQIATTNKYIHIIEKQFFKAAGLLAQTQLGQRNIIALVGQKKDSHKTTLSRKLQGKYLKVKINEKDPQLLLVQPLNKQQTQEQFLNMKLSSFKQLIFDSLQDFLSVVQMKEQSKKQCLLLQKIIFYDLLKLCDKASLYVLINYNNEEIPVSDVKLISSAYTQFCQNSDCQQEGFNIILQRNFIPIIEITDFCYMFIQELQKCLKKQVDQTHKNQIKKDLRKADKAMLQNPDIQKWFIICQSGQNKIIDFFAKYIENHQQIQKQLKLKYPDYFIKKKTKNSEQAERQEENQKSQLWSQQLQQITTKLITKYEELNKIYKVNFIKAIQKLKQQIQLQQSQKKQFNLTILDKICSVLKPNNIIQGSLISIVKTIYPSIVQLVQQEKIYNYNNITEQNQFYHIQKSNLKMLTNINKGKESKYNQKMSSILNKETQQEKKYQALLIQIKKVEQDKKQKMSQSSSQKTEQQNKNIIQKWTKFYKVKQFISLKLVSMIICQKNQSVYSQRSSNQSYLLNQLLFSNGRNIQLEKQQKNNIKKQNVSIVQKQITILKNMNFLLSSQLKKNQTQIQVSPNSYSRSTIAKQIHQLFSQALLTQKIYATFQQIQQSLTYLDCIQENVDFCKNIKKLTNQEADQIKNILQFTIQNPQKVGVHKFLMQKINQLQFYFPKCSQILIFLYLSITFRMKIIECIQKKNNQTESNHKLQTLKELIQSIYQDKHLQRYTKMKKNIKNLIQTNFNNLLQFSYAAKKILAECVDFIQQSNLNYNKNNLKSYNLCAKFIKICIRSQRQNQNITNEFDSSIQDMLVFKRVDLKMYSILCKIQLFLGNMFQFQWYLDMCFQNKAFQTYNELEQMIKILQYQKKNMMIQKIINFIIFKRSSPHQNLQQLMKKYMKIIEKNQQNGKKIEQKIYLKEFQYQYIKKYQLKSQSWRIQEIKLKCKEMLFGKKIN